MKFILCLLLAAANIAAQSAAFQAISTDTAITVSAGSARINSQVFLLSVPMTISLGVNASGYADIYVASNGTIGVSANMPVTCQMCSLTITDQGGSPNFPLDSIPLYQWQATSGKWVASTDYRAALSRDAVTFRGGFSVLSTSEATIVDVAPQSAPVQTGPVILTGSATLDFGTIDAGGHSSSAALITVTGATVADAVLIGLPFAANASIFPVGRVIAPNIVAVYLYNAAAYPVTLNGALMKAAVFQIP